MGFFLSLIIIMGIQYAISAVFQAFGVPQLYIEIVINLVLAIVFTYWNFSRLTRSKKIFSDVSFHLNVCIWFSILTAFSAFWVL